MLGHAESTSKNSLQGYLSDVSHHREKYSSWFFGPLSKGFFSQCKQVTDVLVLVLGPGLRPALGLVLVVLAPVLVLGPALASDNVVVVVGHEDNDVGDNDMERDGEEDNEREVVMQPARAEAEVDLAR
jgi:hypothetical protein